MLRKAFRASRRSGRRSFRRPADEPSTPRASRGADFSPDGEGGRLRLDLVEFSVYQTKLILGRRNEGLTASRDSHPAARRRRDLVDHAHLAGLPERILVFPEVL